MKATLRYWAELIHGSYWFIPAVMTFAALLLSTVMIWLDTRISADAVDRFGWLVYTGGAEGGRGVLESIAGSMITVAGVVFSITIVALTLASSQFGPRILANFMRDDGNKVVLGTFIAAYIYSLLILRAIRTGGEAAPAVVPHLSITMALLLALASLGVLIYFIHHVAIAIQAPHLIARIAHELHSSIDDLYPEELPRGVGSERDPAPMDDLGRAAAIAAERNGYLDTVDLEGLMTAAVERDVVVMLDRRPGQFVTRGSILARVSPAERAEEVSEAVRDACVIGPRRTAIQDVEFTMDQLVEIAVRALSPGINDPFTAVNCIDHLGAALTHLGRRRIPSPVRADAEGRARLAIAHPITFSGLTDTALHQIRQNAASHAAVYLRLLEVLAVVVESLPYADRVDPLLRHAEMIARCGLDQVPDPRDRDDIEERYRQVLEAAHRRRGPLLATG